MPVGGCSLLQSVSDPMLSKLHVHHSYMLAGLDGGVRQAAVNMKGRVLDMEARPVARGKRGQPQRNNPRYAALSLCHLEVTMLNVQFSYGMTHLCVI